MNNKKYILIFFLLVFVFKLQAQVEPLIKDNWLTGKPYNSVFPIDISTGQNYDVGCIEISMSRVLHYWKWPKTGKGADFYRRGSVLFDAVLSGTQYNWDHMPDDLPIGAALEDSKDVSLLIYHVLVASRHAINGGDVNAAKSALVDNFQMKNTLQLVKRANFSRDEWINIAKNELDNGRPIIVQGITIDSPLPDGNFKGHQFLCDGYNSDGKFHIRWGWGNVSDEYYDIDAFGEYPKNNIFIIGIEPNSSATDADLKAYFLANQASGGVPHTVEFTNKAINVASDASFLWEFGDGTTSNQENPVHTYTSIGNYTVSLKINSNGNEDTQKKDNYIEVTESYANNKSDSLALVALYNQNGGDNWISHENWLTGSLDTWENVTLENGRVVALNLYSYTNKFGLTGDLTPEIAKLTALKMLRFSNNDLTGSLPSDIGNMQALESLILYDNQISGDIPQSIGNLKNLKRIWLHFNNLSGAIPSSIGNMENLQDIEISWNQLSGNVPATIANLSKIETIDLRNNNLTGNFPTFGSISSLQILALSNNQFSGLSDLSSVFGNPITLWVENNYLTFESLEPYMQLKFSNGYNYSPQNSLKDTIIYRKSGDQIIIDPKIGGSQNNYKWYKDAIALNNTGNTLIMNNIDNSNAGIYHCEATSDLVPNLTILSRNINLIVDSSNGINTTSQDEINIFPNPSNGQFFVSHKHNIQKIKIYTISGNEVYYRQGVLDQNISIQLNDRGLYIVQVITINGEIINEKIVIN